EDGRQRLAEGAHGDLARLVLLGGPGAEPAVDRLVRVEEDRGEGEVEVDPEERQVEAVRLGDPHAHEAAEELLDAGVEAGHALIEAAASLAGDAADDHQEGFPRLAGLLQAAREVVVDPLASAEHALAVLADPGLPVFSRFEGAEEEEGGGQE